MTTTSAPLIPRTVLFGNPERVAPAISPDGKRLAYLAPLDGILNVFVATVGADDAKPITNETTRPIPACAWAYDNKHVVYLRDTGGDENWHVYKADPETGETTDLTPFDGVQARIQAVRKEFPDEILVGLNKDNPQLHDVYRVSLASGEMTKVAENPGFIGWVVDAELQARGAITMTPDGGSVVLARDTVDSEWRPVYQTTFEDGIATPISFTRDGSKLLLITAKDANATRLVELDLASGDTRVIAEDPAYDVAGAHLDPDTFEVQMVTYLKARQETVVLDPAVEADVAAIAAIHPGDWDVQSEDASDRTWLIAFTADDGPVAYYAYDRDAKQATFLFRARPALADYALAAMEPFSFTARDGLVIHGYLTFPPGAERSNLPTILNVHGGPWVRDAWGFDPEAQWMANRGYLCVQVNYRGSTGYGKDFVNAGNKEWGAKMHTDLLDAVDWLVEQGYADRAKVGIYGGSYGGYAALVGATFTPDVFACAVDIVGPSNLNTLLESIPPYWAPMVAQFHERMGNPATDGELLWERSPLSKVDAIKIPMLIAQGANDPRVKQAESEQIVAAMQEKGIPHEYLLYENEGHGFAHEDNRLHFYGAAEQFLARHLGGRCEEPGKPDLDA